MEQKTKSRNLGQKIFLEEDYGAAKRFGVRQQTLSDRLKQASCTLTGSGHCTTQESKPAQTKPTDMAMGTTQKLPYL